jgi:transposase
MDIVVLGIDLGKNVCSVVGLGAAGQVLVRRRMKRESVVTFTQRWPSSLVAMEACCGAHHLGRQLAAQGHTVRLMSPEYVRPYAKAQKNDDRDAEAIAEAATRPTMRFIGTSVPPPRKPMTTRLLHPAATPLGSLILAGGGKSVQTTGTTSRLERRA